MPEVLLLVEPETNSNGQIVGLSPATRGIVAALKQAISKASPDQDIAQASFFEWTTQTIVLSPEKQPQLETPSRVAGDFAIAQPGWAAQFNQTSQWLCPLTLAVPDALRFPEQEIYKVCRNVQQLQQLVLQQFGIPTDHGELWLPIVLTAKGFLYAEAITHCGGIVAEAIAPAYEQPFHLPDHQRQPLYQFAHRLLQSLSAPPAVYLIQCGFQADQLYFDRLFPFPAEPAIASIGFQQPDLFECHWRCLTGQPIVDLKIFQKTVNSYPQ
jgi:hypothetical protein